MHVNAAWVEALRDVAMNGSESSPRGLTIREILCRTMSASMEYPVVSVKRRKLGKRFLAAEAWWIISGRNDVEGIAPYSLHIASFSDDGFFFSGAYGPRIVDQLRYVVDTLSRDPDTRQAVLEIWRPNPRDSKDIPCTLTVQWFVRDQKLHCIDSMRSSDLWLGAPYDVFNFSMLSAYILLLLRARNEAIFNRVKLGNIWLTAGSSHLYVDPANQGATNIPYNLKLVEELLAANPLSDDEQLHYAPLDVDEFRSPTELIQHLGMLKDGRDSGHSWLREFLTKKES